MKSRIYPYAFIVAFIFLWTITASLFSNILPLDVLENLGWGQLWQWGYYKHPPLQAWQQEAMVVLLGRKEWPAFLLSFMNIGIAFYFLYKIANQIGFPLWLCRLLLALGAMIYYYNLRAVEFNANVASLPLWLAYISCFIAACTHRQKFIYWIMLGVISALGLLTKYSFGILLFSSLPAILCLKRYRNLLWHMGPYIAVIVMLAILYPHIQWLCDTKFLPFRYIRKSTEIQQEFWEYLINPILFIFLQFLVILPSLLALYWTAKPKRRKLLTDKQKLAIMLAVFPLVFLAILGWFFPSGVRTFWGYTLPLVLLLVISMYGWEKREVFSERAHILSFFSILLPCAMYMGIIILKPYISNKGKRVDADGLAFTQMAQDYWYRHTKEESLPPWIVTNTHWAGEMISWYSENRPKLIYVYGGPYGYGWSPWVGQLVRPYKDELRLFWVSRKDIGLRTPKGFCLYQVERVSLPWKNKRYSQKIEYDFAIYKKCPKKKINKKP